MTRPKRRIEPLVPNACVHCEEPLGATTGASAVPFAYPRSGYVAHLRCVSLANYDAMDVALTGYWAPRRVLRVAVDPAQAQLFPLKEAA